MGLFRNIYNNLFAVRYTDGSWWYGNNSAKTNNQEYIRLFETVYPLNAVINIGATYASKFKWGVKVSDTEIDYDHPLLELIKNPNPYQTTVDLIKQLYIYKSVYGWAYQKTFGDVIDKTALYNLDPANIDFDTKNNNPLLVWKKSDLNNLKKDTFTYNDNGNEKTFYLGEVMKYYDISNGIRQEGCGMYTSPSKVKAVLDSITNIDTALDAENVAMQSVGREAIFATGQKQGNTAESFLSANKGISEGERKDVDNKLNNKGWLKSKRLRSFTPQAPIGHLDMSLKYKNYGFTECLDKHESIIAREFNIPLELYQSYKSGATFENQQVAIVKLIDDINESFIKDVAYSWTKDFGDERTPFVATANHLRVLQKEEDKKADKALKISQALANLQRSGIENGMEFLTDLGIDLNE